MSTAALAPERLPFGINKNTQSGPRASTYKRQVLCAFCLVMTDLLAIFLSLKSAVFLRAHLVPFVDKELPTLRLPSSHYPEFGWLWLLLLLFLGVEGLYTQRRTLWNEIGHLVKAIVSCAIVIFAAIAVVQRGPVFSRLTIVLTAVILLAVLPAVRYWAKRVLGIADLWRKRILILGATDTAKLAIRGFATDPVLGYEVVGLLDDEPKRWGSCFGTFRGKSIYILGNLTDAAEQMHRTGAQDLLIAMPNLQEEKLLALVHGLQPACESLYVIPQLWGLPLMNLRIDGFLRERLMMLKLSNNLAKPWNSWLKRTFDLVVGFVITLLALPLSLIIAALIKIDSGGPVFFVQERLGHNGRNFRCIKFRSMHIESDEMLISYLARNPAALAEWHRYAKLRVHDPRLTRVGQLLRRWSLDELPQLLNVLKGDMSLVGPRPYLPQERERIGVELFTILSSRPGITGFWQVNGRNHLTLEDRVQLEAWYVRNWTIWFDCIILGKTFRAVCFPHNRYDFVAEVPSRSR